MPFWMLRDGSFVYRDDKAPSTRGYVTSEPRRPSPRNRPRRRAVEPSRDAHTIVEDWGLEPLAPDERAKEDAPTHRAIVSSLNAAPEGDE